MNKDINVINKKKSYNMKHCKKKFIPTAWFFDVENQTDENPSGFFCYYEEGVWDKYGLHYIEHNGNEIEHIHRKSKKYGRPPYAFNNYDEMMKQTETLAKAMNTVDDMGNIRKEAVYLILDLDANGNLVSDPCDFEGYVTKKRTVFNITSSGTYDGKKRFVLTDKNEHLVFADMGKAATYLHEKYGWWACVHYLKNHPNFL